MIKDMFAQFMDEIDGAKEYFECSLKHRDNRPDFAKMYSSMGSTELEHASDLLGMVKKLSQGHPEENGGILVEIMEEQLMRAKAMRSAME